ncbi:hypothetical protein U1Q18_018622 [Sarracenia purpurea var. burkii]
MGNTSSMLTQYDIEEVQEHCNNSFSQQEIISLYQRFCQLNRNSGGFISADEILSAPEFTVHLELLYCPFGTESGFTNPFNPDFRLTSLEKALKTGIDGTEVPDIAKPGVQKRKDVIVRGVLSVTVIAAENLPSVDIMGKSDPFVVLIMKKSEQKSKTRVMFLMPYSICCFGE